MTRPLAPGSTLVIATHNPGKLVEIAELLTPLQVHAMSAGQLGLPEPDETAPDFVGNAQIKALAAALASGMPALADDSGFSVAALGGAPGVVSARWAGPSKDFTMAMTRVRTEMLRAHTELGDAADRRGWFTCALCLAWPDGKTATFLGRTEGTVIWPPRGGYGFGYDPMFVPVGDIRSYGEMPPAEKHASSHRARAFAQLLAACLTRA